MSETHVFPVVTRTEIDYKRPAKLGDWITIRGRLDEISRARFWCAFEMIREADGVTARHRPPVARPRRHARWQTAAPSRRMGGNVGLSP